MVDKAAKKAAAASKSESKDQDSNGVKKTKCAVTREEFRQGAKAVEVSIAGVPQLAEAKEFSTGSLGWYLNGKVPMKIGDKVVTVQIGLNLTIVGSKDLPGLPTVVGG
jgi:hypothetical protein